MPAVSACQRSITFALLHNPDSLQLAIILVDFWKQRLSVVENIVPIEPDFLLI